MRDYTQADAANVAAQIEALKRDYPQLEEDADLLRDTITGETNFDGVLSRVVEAALEAKFLSEGISAYMDAMKARQARLEARGDTFRLLAQSLMKTAGETKVTLPIATLSIRQGPSSVVIEDLDAIPQGLFRIETTKIPLKKELKEALAAGDQIPGARLSTPEPSIQIRSK